MSTETGAARDETAPVRRTAPVLVARATCAVAMLVIGALLAYLSVFDTIKTDQRDHATWAAATRLVRRGVPATHVNAGLDWDGFHSAPVDRKEPELNLYRGQYWSFLFPAATDCWIVSTSSIGRHFVRKVRTEKFPGQLIWIYRNPTCRTPLAKPMP